MFVSRRAVSYGARCPGLIRAWTKRRSGLARRASADSFGSRTRASRQRRGGRETQWPRYTGSAVASACPSIRLDVATSLLCPRKTTPSIPDRRPRIRARIGEILLRARRIYSGVSSSVKREQLMASSSRLHHACPHLMAAILAVTSWNWLTASFCEQAIERDAPATVLPEGHRKCARVVLLPTLLCCCGFRVRLWATAASDKYP